MRVRPLNRSVRLALVTAAVGMLAVVATACGPEEDGAKSLAASAPAAGDPAGASPSVDVEAPSAQAKTDDSGDTGPQGSGADEGVGQMCGANDLDLHATQESQGGGYLLITAKANSGITCTLPAALPGIAFGSGGIEAGPAEQAVGDEITLSGSATVFAGINPKTTNDNNGTEFTDVIFGVGDEDPNPASLPVGSVTVDEPIVTNWHTSAKDVAPFVLGN